MPLRASSPMRARRSPLMRGCTADLPGDPARMFLRALSVRTGEKRWEQPMLGSQSSWGGALARTGDLVFVADAAGNLVAHAERGTPLWHFSTGNELAASPMTYVAGGRQHVAIASGGAIF